MFIMVAWLAIWMYFVLRWMPIMWYDWRDNECHIRYNWKVEYIWTLWDDNIYMCKTWDAYYKIETPDILDTSTS